MTALGGFNLLVPLRLNGGFPNMQGYDKLENASVNELLGSLCALRTLIHVAVPDGYECLAVIHGLSLHAQAPVFTIIPPVGLRKAIQTRPARQLRFEFTDNDGLRHQFEARVVLDDPHCMYFAVPDHIRRYQLRCDFRIKTHQGVELVFTLNDRRFSLEIENISLGGAFCYCANKHRDVIESHPGLDNIQLVFGCRSQSAIIPVERAEMRRLTHLQRPVFGVAYQFVKISREARKALHHQIYLLQRAYLQNRIRLEK